ncbi:MAG: translation initiation factor IF-6 [Candidatus Hodarchaeota archaeon]
MSILKYQLFGKNSVGVYLTVNNIFGLYPSTLLKFAVKKIKSTFKEPFFPVSINNSTLLGVYLASNRYGIIVPHIVRDDELDNLTKCAKSIKDDYQIGIIKSIDNAFGNLILCNDKGAIISSLLKDVKPEIENTLNVECEVFEFADNYLPGSIGLVNNNGCVVHPLTNDNEIEQISSILKVDEVDVSTVNRGIPYLSSGATINDFNGIFGFACTGPEMMRMTDILGL